LLRARAGSPAFHPSATQRVLEAPAEIFALLRGERDAAGNEGAERVLCLVNLSDHEAEVSYTDGELGLGEEKGFRDLVTNDYVYPSRDHGNRVSIELEAYEVLWLKF
ncbi:MAG: alpha-amylase, partial [Spirochaetota bacterium]